MINLLSLGSDVLILIAMFIDDFDSYVSWIKLCKTTLLLDEAIRKEKMKQLCPLILTSENESGVIVMRNMEMRRVRVPDSLSSIEIKHGKYNETRMAGKTVIMTVNGKFIMDKREGIWIYYNTGTYAEIEYLNNEKHGIERQYSMNGNLVSTHVYDKGVKLH